MKIFIAFTANHSWKKNISLHFTFPKPHLFSYFRNVNYMWPIARTTSKIDARQRSRVWMSGTRRQKRYLHKKFPKGKYAVRPTWLYLLALFSVSNIFPQQNTSSVLNSSLPYFHSIATKLYRHILVYGRVWLDNYLNLRLKNYVFS